MKNFQEAIELVVTSSQKPMTAEEIAQEINRKELYSNWKGNIVSTTLVLGRARQHNDLFSINGDTISVKERYFLKEEGFKRIRNFISHNGFYNSEQFILFGLFWSRMKFAKQNHWVSRQLPDIDILFQNNKYQVRETLMKLERELEESLRPKYDFTLDFFGSLELLEIEYFCEVTLSASEIIVKMDDIEFIDFFQSLIEYFSSQIQSYGLPVSKPKNLKDLNIDLDSNKSISIFDPFCGSSLLVTRLFRSIKDEVTLELQDIDPTMLFISWMNLEVSGFENFSLKIADYMDNSNEVRYDFIVTNPPYWGPKLWQERRERLKMSHDVGTWEEFYFKSFLTQLNPNGKAILYIHDSILTIDGYTNLRKNLLNKDVIREIRHIDEFEAKKTFHKCLLILSKTKKTHESGFVQYFFTKNQLESELMSRYVEGQNLNIRIANTDLLKNTAILNAQHVILEQKLQRLTSGWPTIKELTFLITSGTFKKRNTLVAKEYIVEQGSVPYVRVKDLLKGEGIYLEEEDIELHLVNDETESNPKIIQRPGVLVSKVSGDLRPKVFDGSFPILLDGNIFFLEFDDQRILLEFVFLALSHSLVKFQIQLYSTGSLNKRLNKKNLEQIRLPEKNLNLQNEEIKDYLRKTLEKETRLTKKNQSEKDKKETIILSSIKHELKAQILEPLTTEFRLIRGFSEKTISESNKKISELRISNHIKSRKYFEVVEHVESILENANNLFENIQQIIDLNTSKVNLENVNILKLIKDCVNECRVGEHEILTVYSFQSIKTQTLWKVDRLKLKNAFSNFIRNTLKHAFAERTEKKYLVFNVAHNQEKNTLDINMLDNGVGLVGGFEFADLVEFGKQNQSKGTGIGGYLMKRSIEIHNGSIDDLSKVEEYISIPNLNNYPFIKFQKEIEWIKIKIGVHFKITIPTIEL